MGSCFSKKEKEEKEKLSAAAADSREPPAPESPQEEKVKEVLSETPKPRPSARRTTSPQQEQKKKKEEPEKTKKGEDEPICYDQRSEDTLEVYSIISESFSASTPLADQKKKKKNDDEEEEVEEHKRRAERSPARRCHHQRKRSFSGELQQQPAAVKVGCRSGRSSPSPPVGRTHSAREPAAARTRPLAHSSHQCEKFRRDHSGDRSARRSLSPARKLAAVPDHRRSNGGGQCRGLSGRCSPQRAAAAAAAAATEGGSGIGGGLEEESLENPLVSLECFIFL